MGFFSQSGQLASHFIRTGAHQGLGFSKVVSFGNASDLQAHDFLNYLAKDDKTDVIGCYLEGLSDGRAFFQAAKSVTRTKPLVLWKGGQTEGGSRATQSHTAALAGSPSIWAALCRQTGIVSVRSLEEMVCTVSALQRLPRPAGTNVAILGGAGGGSVTMTDIAENEGLKVPHLTQGTIRQLEEFVPLQGNSARNPLDVGAALSTDDHFMKLVDLLRDDPNIDALVFTLPLYWLARDTGRAGVNRLLRGTIEARDRLKKPALFVLESDGDLRADIMIRDARDWYRERKVPTFPSFRMAARVLSNLSWYGEYVDRRA